MSIDTAREGAHTDQEAEELRNALVSLIIERQEQLAVPLPSTVEAALRKVPRHLFTPGVSLQVAYGTGSVVTKQDERGINLSAVSAPAMIAVMLSQAGDLHGKRVLEIGSGGYNAALLRELVGMDGSVTTIDIDSDVVKRARTCLKAAGYDDIRVLCGDGEFGAESDSPFDLIIATVGAWDIPPAWITQLAEGGRLVLPLRTLGMTRSWAFERSNGHLVSRSSLMSGFVPMQGAGEHRGHGIPIQGEQVGLWIDEDQQADAAALGDVLSTPRGEIWSGVTVGRRESFADLDVWLATHL
ncbi:methyltransferase, FxLD system, partial [Streptomyces anulatus]|uniref:methyltransferase, FxLD system n=1 Tax=Streptomyces anulatus TaxID=1892 RepID=UPI003413E55F